MKKINLKTAAEEFEMISDETHLFYNTDTGEFDFYSDFAGFDDDDSEKFEEGCWIAAPRQRDIGEYDMMVDFADTVKDPRANELLCVALEGRGTFRRFKDTLHRVDLIEEWYSFKHKAYVELAREWCEENDIPYENTAAGEGKDVPTPDDAPPKNLEPVEITMVKLEIYIPVTHFEALRETLRSVGAGASDKYDSALSYAPAKGCWRPLSGANPYHGEIGALCEADEYKVEVRCPLEKLGKIVEAVKAVHPYEEPVINALPLIVPIE